MIEEMEIFGNSLEFKEILDERSHVRFLRAANWNAVTAENLVHSFLKFLNDFPDCLENSLTPR